MPSSSVLWYETSQQGDAKAICFSIHQSSYISKREAADDWGTLLLLLPTILKLLPFFTLFHDIGQHRKSNVGRILLFFYHIFTAFGRSLSDELEAEKYLLQW